jgi:hypothetical protein
LQERDLRRRDFVALGSVAIAVANRHANVFAGEQLLAAQLKKGQIL